MASSVVIRPVELKDAPAVAAMLHQGMDSRVSAERWQQLFHYDWAPSRPDLGFLAEDEQGLLGFVGVVYNEVDPLTVNLGSWCVLPRARGLGVGHGLLTKIFSRPGTRYTVFTAAVYLVEAYYRMGFRAIDDHRYVCRFHPDAGSVVRAWHDDSIPEHELNEKDARILRDHRPHRCRFALLEAAGERCFVVLKDFARKNKPGFFTETLYASSPAFLSLHPSAMANHLTRGENSSVAIDGRFLIDAPAYSAREELATPRLVKSKEPFDPRAIFPLYGEVVLLDVKM